MLRYFTFQARFRDLAHMHITQLPLPVKKQGGWQASGTNQTHHI